MAILRWINAANDSVLQLQDLITYLLYDHKTSEKKLVGGRGCFYSHALRDFLCIKRLWHKEGGSLFEHFILSFSEWNAQHRIQEIMEISGLIAVYFHDFQCLYAVHTDTEHTHIHFLLNSVSFSDGKKFSQSKGDLHRFKAHCNEVLNRYGFAIIATASENIYIEAISTNGGYEIMNHTQNTDNLDIEYDYDETEDCHNYAHNNWYDEDEEYEDDEDKGTASALHRFAPDFIHSDADLLEEYKKCNIPNRYQYTPPEDDDCYIINNSRNLTVHLDDPSNIEPLQKFIDCFQESADEEEERHNQAGIAVAQEFDQHSIHRRIIVDSSINLTIDLRKHSASNFVDTCLADDDDDEE